jgi:hypothetical protein
MDMELEELLWMGGMISYLSISYGRRIKRGVVRVSRSPTARCRSLSSVRLRIREAARLTVSCLEMWNPHLDIETPIAAVTFPALDIGEVRGTDQTLSRAFSVPLCSILVVAWLADECGNTEG